MHPGLHQCQGEEAGRSCPGTAAGLLLLQADPQQASLAEAGETGARQPSDAAEIPAHLAMTFQNIGIGRVF